MFESQHLQTVWFTGLAAHQEPTSQALRPEAMHQAASEPEFRPPLLRTLATIARRAVVRERKPQGRAEVAPDCCPAPTCC